MSKKQTKRSGSGLSEAAQTWYHQGLHAFKRGTYEQAITQWNKVRADKTYSPNPALEAAVAEAHFRAGQQLIKANPAASLDHLITASTLQPQDALYTYHIGLAYQRQRDFGQAVQSLEKALSLDPKFQRAAYLLAIALTHSGKDPAKHRTWGLLTPTQRAQLSHSVEQADQTALTAAFHLLEKDQWEQAEPLLAQVAQDISASTPGAVRGLALYYLGVHKQRQKNSEEAVTAWRKAAELGVDTPSLQHNLSASYLPSVERIASTENWEAALSEVEQALKAVPDNKRLRELFNYITFQQGYSAALQGHWQVALQYWQTITGLTGPNARNLSINLAIAFEKLDQFEQAADAWREFVRRRTHNEDSADWLSPEQVSRLWSRISSLYQKAGEPEAAVTTLQTALKYQADDADVRVRLAHAYAETERFEAAHNEVNRALALAPEHIGALVLHAELTEFSPLRADWRRHMDEEPGITEWKAVLAAKDEAYDSVAREHLYDLYHKQMSRANFMGIGDTIGETLKEAVSVLPDDSVMRAEYVDYLLVEQADVDEANKQIAQIDLTDEDAVIIVASAWIGVKSPGEAAALIQKADALKTLSFEFFTGLGGVLLEMKREDDANRYFDEALRRMSGDRIERFRVRLDIAAHYLENKYEEKGLSLINEVLKEERGFGPALMVRGLYFAGKRDTKVALKDLNDAEKWAKNNNQPELVQVIRQMKAMINSPFGPAFGGPFGPFSGASSFDDLDLDDLDFGDEDDSASLPSPLLIPRRGKSKPKKNS